MREQTTKEMKDDLKLLLDSIGEDSYRIWAEYNRCGSSWEDVHYWMGEVRESVAAAARILDQLESTE